MGFGWGSLYILAMQHLRWFKGNSPSYFFCQNKLPTVCYSWHHRIRDPENIAGAQAGGLVLAHAKLPTFCLDCLATSSIYRGTNAIVAYKLFAPIR
jgi:hypothetical protein